MCPNHTKLTIKWALQLMCDEDPISMCCIPFFVNRISSKDLINGDLTHLSVPVGYFVNIHEKFPRVEVIKASSYISNVSPYRYWQGRVDVLQHISYTICLPPTTTNSSPLILSLT